MKLRDCIGPDDITGEIVPTVQDRRKQAYLSTDDNHYGEPCRGRGEVLIRGPSVSSGYLKQPEKTAESFDEEGWFHSGDIAIFTMDGCIKVRGAERSGEERRTEENNDGLVWFTSISMYTLSFKVLLTLFTSVRRTRAVKIVDRLKNLVKLKGGEYVAIESMEKEYSKSIFVNALAGGIMCYGDGDMDRPVALVQANCVELGKWATSNGIAFKDNDDLCANPAVEAYALSDLNKEGRLGGVGANEILMAVTLISGEGEPTEQEPNSPWTPENQFLTASNKLNRKPIQMGLEDILEPLKQRGIKN